jgi:hypothetical protein
VSATTYTGANPTVGCAIRIHRANDGPQDPSAIVLSRFGVLLAVNARAHQLYLTPPLATSAERSLAQRMIALG